MGFNTTELDNEASSHSIGREERVGEKVVRIVNQAQANEDPNSSGSQEGAESLQAVASDLTKLRRRVGDISTRLERLPRLASRVEFIESQIGIGTQSDLLRETEFSSMAEALYQIGEIKTEMEHIRGILAENEADISDFSSDLDELESSVYEVKREKLDSDDFRAEILTRNRRIRNLGRLIAPALFLILTSIAAYGWFIGSMLTFWAGASLAAPSLVMLILVWGR